LFPTPARAARNVPVRVRVRVGVRVPDPVAANARPKNSSPAAV
jgi:hypothetical protein